jgi:hypothetical protein
VVSQLSSSEIHIHVEAMYGNTDTSRVRDCPEIEQFEKRLSQNCSIS